MRMTPGLGDEQGRAGGPMWASLVKVLGPVSGVALLLAGCATQPVQTATRNGRYFDPRLGVYASDKVVQDGEPVPRGGGGYLTGRPYVIAGRTYIPQQNASGYVAVGTASWYGDAFHGRRTANGEVFDKSSVSAAHPTLPLPSYVRVTNIGNGRSMIVRVNDRGPYHGGRVMDVSQRVAETLDFRRAGTARIKVEYVGRASLEGSDDEKLMATLRTDGGAAQLPGSGGSSVGTALASLVAPLVPGEPSPPSPPPQRAMRNARSEERQREADDSLPGPYGKNAGAPLPPSRPFDMNAAPASRRRGWRDHLADGR